MNIRGGRYTVLLLILFSVIILKSESSLIAGVTASEGAVDFIRIWELVKVSSDAVKAAAAESEAADIMKMRQGRHWLPRVYAEGSGYITNDAGLNFMSNMGQRSVTAEDFNPDSLNKPGTKFYRKGTIGVELPVYEGGAGVENARAAEKIAEASRFREGSVYLDEFSSAASAYGRAIVLLETDAELKELNRRVTSILGNYQGSLRSNPVEYSGILGLRALNNRIEALIAGNRAKADSLRDYLVKMSGNGIPQGWVPSGSDAVEFADTWLKVSESAGAENSYLVKAYESLAESAKRKAEAGKSIFLPKVGLFSEGNVYNGERNTADSYTAGFYIRVNILSPMDYGSVKQAELESEAAAAKFREARLKARIELQRLSGFSETLKSNIRVLKESIKIMDEQIRNSQKLYASGSLRSFQLAEVFSRKADLIVNLAGAEEEYVNVRSGIYNLAGRADEVKHDR